MIQDKSEHMLQFSSCAETLLIFTNSLSKNPSTVNTYCDLKNKNTSMQMLNKVHMNSQLLFIQHIWICTYQITIELCTSLTNYCICMHLLPMSFIMKAKLRYSNNIA